MFTLETRWRVDERSNHWKIEANICGICDNHEVEMRVLAGRKRIKLRYSSCDGEFIGMGRGRVLEWIARCLTFRDGAKAQRLFPNLIGETSCRPHDVVAKWGHGGGGGRGKLEFIWTIIL